MMDRRSLDDFPDPILGHIISFLPTNLAFQTSVLSKRWRYIWKSLPNFDFHEEDDDDVDDDKRIRFMDFVDRALCVSEAPPINRLSLVLYIDSEFVVSRIRKWISAAVSRNPKEFDFCFIDIFDFDEIMYFDCLFNCETLEKLLIEASARFRLPSRIYLPNLKILKLIGFHFMNNDHELNILFASSVLEELVIDSCSFEGHETSHLVFSAPKLQSLTIKIGDLDGDIACSSVMICAPLKTLYFHGELEDYQLSCSSSLVEATLLFCYGTEEVGRFLRSLRLVKYLKLSSYELECLSHVTLPIFENLTSLEFLKDYSIRLGCKELEMFLNHCPVLETLRIPVGIKKDDEDTNHPLSPKLAWLSSLKSIMIGSFKGNTEELAVVQDLLVKATSLETMEIWMCDSMDVSERKKLKTFLSALPMGSESCKLNFRCYIQYNARSMELATFS